MTSAGTITLNAALGTLPILAPLKDGSVKIPGIEFNFVGPDNQVEVWRTQSRTLEFDFSLMSIVSYLCAVEYNIPITLFPVTLRGEFHHGDFSYNVKSGIKEPKDFEGKKVLSRCYTVTPGTLDRCILKDEFGVNLDSITWVMQEREHVPQAQDHLPPNVIPGKDENLFHLLANNEVQAGIAGSNLFRGQSDDVKPLFPNARELDKAYYQRTGIIQPFVSICVKNSVIEQHPWALEALYQGLKEAKAKANVQAEGAMKEIIGDADPTPFGLSANRKAFEEVIRTAYEQHIISRPFPVDDIFPHFD